MLIRGESKIDLILDSRASKFFSEIVTKGYMLEWHGRIQGEDENRI